MDNLSLRRLLPIHAMADPTTSLTAPHEQ
jgi:hypothetical protein